MKILVAEDDFRSVHVFEKLLDKKGHHIITTSNGFDCLKVYQEKLGNAKSQETPFDVVMIDFAMPKIDGITVIKKIKSWCPTQKIILMTAYTKELITKIPKEVADIPFLEKPISLSKLINTIEGTKTKTVSEQINSLGIKEWNNFGELETPPAEKKLTLSSE